MPSAANAGIRWSGRRSSCPSVIGTTPGSGCVLGSPSSTRRAVAAATSTTTSAPFCPLSVRYAYLPSGLTRTSFM